MNIKKVTQIILAIAIIALSTTFIFAQKKAVAVPKTQLVNQLITHTSAGYPTALFGQILTQVKETSFNSFNEGIVKSLTEKIESEKKFSAEQKTKLKAQLPEFSQKLSDKFFAQMQNSFKIEQWIKDSMTQEYSKFTVAELNKLVTFFKTPGGKSFINLMKESSENGINGIEAEPNIDTRYAIQVEKFLKSPLGEKFYDSFTKKVTDSVQAKCSNWTNTFMNDMNKEEYTGMIVDFINQV
jgi:hypothetical protein